MSALVGGRESLEVNRVGDARLRCSSAGSIALDEIYVVECVNFKLLCFQVGEGVSECIACGMLQFL